MMPAPPAGSTVTRTADGDVVWNTTSFPSTVPRGREQVVRLEAMLQSMLSQLKGPETDRRRRPHQNPLHGVRELLRVAKEEEVVDHGLDLAASMASLPSSVCLRG